MAGAQHEVSFGSFPPRLRYITRLIKLSLFSVNYGGDPPTFSHYGTQTRERRRLVRDSPVEFQMNVHREWWWKIRLFLPSTHFILSSILSHFLITYSSYRLTNKTKYALRLVSANLSDCGTRSSWNSVNNLLANTNMSCVTLSRSFIYFILTVAGTA